MGKSLVTASLVVYHNPIIELKRVIDSFLRTNIDSKVFIIDNSADDSLRTNFNEPRIIYIFNNQNLGFGVAHNLAIRESVRLGSEFHVLLNPDIEFNQSVIPVLLGKMTEDNSIGAIMPKILYPSGETQYLCKLLPAPRDLIFRRFMPFFYSDQQRNNYELRFASYDEEKEVPTLSGCFLLARTSVLEKIGGFDNRFFMYLEDVDLSRRIGEVSKLYYLPQVSVNHVYEKGSYKSLRLLLYHISSAVKYFNKWGWLKDQKRKQVNNKILKQLEEKN